MLHLGRYKEGKTRSGFKNTGNFGNGKKYIFGKYIVGKTRREYNFTVV